MRFSGIILFFSLIFFAAFVSCFGDKSVSEREYSGVPYPYRSYDEAVDFLKGINSNYPNITRLEYIGKSVRGRGIAAFAVSAGGSKHKPRVRLTGSIHGNEYISSEILFRFIDYLVAEYGVDPRVTNLLDNHYIAIIPILNPDGHESGKRYNDGNVDLNRNFPFYNRDLPRRAYQGREAFDQPESRAVKDYSGKKFHLSVTFHSGEVVVNLPFDYAASEVLPDENTLIWELGRIYADSGITHIFKNNPELYPYADEGVINGGDWYIIDGSLQDWSYKDAGCIDITVEVARSSPLTDEGIKEVFLYNRDSLLAYIEAAGNGIYGKVVDENEEPIEGVLIKRDGADDFAVYTDEDGYFMRALEADFSLDAELYFSKEGYIDNSIKVYEKGKTVVLKR